MLLLGTLTNRRGQVVASSYLTAEFPNPANPGFCIVTPHESATAMAAAVGYAEPASNPGPVAGIDALQPLIAHAVRPRGRRDDRRVRRRPGRDHRPGRRNGRGGSRDWDEDAGRAHPALGARASAAVSVEEEKAIAARMVPERQLVRPLLVVVPQITRSPDAGRGGIGHGRERRPDRRRGLDQRALLHHRREVRVVPGQGARTAQGMGRGRQETAPRTVRSRFTPRAAAWDVDSPTCSPASRTPPTTACPSCTPSCATMLGYNSGEYTAEADGPGHPCRHAGSQRGRAAGHRRGAGRRDRRGPDRQGRRDALTRTRSTRRRRSRRSARLLSALFVADDGPSSPWCSRAGGCWSPSGRAGPRAATSPSTCSWSASATRTKRGGEIDRALTCVGAESLAPDAEGGIWWRGVLEDSVKHTVGVSQDLREGVRLSIEIIANEVVAAAARKRLDPLPQDQAQPLARQALRYLYRILFLLYAEASPELEVLPVGARVRPGLRPRPAARADAGRAGRPARIDGTHLYESLGLLFRLVDQGHEPPAAGGRASSPAWSSTACAPTCSCRRRPRSSTRPASATRPSSGYCATCCSARRRGARTAASSPTPSSASTSSARCTRA